MRVLLDGQPKVVVVRGLLDHRDLVEALGLERQRGADLLLDRALGAFDEQRCFVEVGEADSAGPGDRFGELPVAGAAADVEPVAAGVAHGDDELRGGRRAAAGEWRGRRQGECSGSDEDGPAHSGPPSPSAYVSRITAATGSRVVRVEPSPGRGKVRNRSSG